MSYRVIRDDQAIASLQRVYDAAADKEAVEHAVLRVGMELSANPLEAGESRDKGIGSCSSIPSSFSTRSTSDCRKY